MRTILLITLFSWTISCVKDRPLSSDLGPPVNPPKVLKAAILVAHGVNDQEVKVSAEILNQTHLYSEKGIQTYTIAESRNPIITGGGAELIPDYIFTDTTEVDILIIPGLKSGWDAELRKNSIATFIRRSAKNSAYVIMFHNGVITLAAANLEGMRECVANPEDAKRLVEVFPLLRSLQNVSFVHDRKCITSVGGENSGDALLYLTELLYGKDAAVNIGKSLSQEWDLSKTPYKRTGV